MFNRINILFQSLVKPFYKENATVIFLVYMFFLLGVGHLDGEGIYEMQIKLVTALLNSTSFLLIVFFCWLLYVRKVAAFVHSWFKKPELAFLSIFNSLGVVQRFFLLLLIQVCLLLPILIYLTVIFGIGLYHHFYTSLIYVAVYICLLCIVPVFYYLFSLNPLNKVPSFAWKGIDISAGLLPAYPRILVRFVAARQKVIWLGIKIITCGLLYGIARNNTLSEYDVAFPCMFFVFGILTNAIIIHRIRAFEESNLSFYRGLPVSMKRRWGYFALVYFILLIPEFITAALLTPVHLHYADALNFALLGYSLTLMMASITYLADFTMKGFLLRILLLFSIQYSFIIKNTLIYLYPSYFVLAFLFYCFAYYRFETIAEK
ncbi:hypothetical protein A3860_05130 [Niastella vici]|uniref:Uncharacterized protein n=1 Tax=Niastella vici TaxID=1703345 RepID=A0A1V9FRX1_9BACT|nr:hypothetical protein [Niastella vici]OQP61104.1 hypothetical protein A3860_05130 [Niastella vici]